MYHDDEKVGLQIYTDLGYIHHLWIEDQNQRLEKRRKRVSLYLVNVLI